MRANEDLEHFAYTASHDLQEPIRTIAIYSELVKRKYGDLLDDIGHEFLNYINGGAKRLEKLVQDLLAYTRATAIRDELPDPESSIAAIKAAEANLSEVIRESRADVHYEALPCVRMREVHLQQLFQNLIGNAIKYRSDLPPRVSISASMAGRFWLFQVRDNGIGISPDYKDSIFEIFNRLHTSEEYGGTGIGLAICRRIVDRYQGKIWVESEIGRGSTFFFTVPA
jgi:light-regulated signal transduction histidine kinase (bacteriophytochrome)